jgi:hypothetical protein
MENSRLPLLASMICASLAFTENMVSGLPFLLLNRMWNLVMLPFVLLLNALLTLAANLRIVLPRMLAVWGLMGPLLRWSHAERIHMLQES